jgi:hypothetical protein
VRNFHVVFDDWFTTAVSNGTEPPDEWYSLFGDSHFQYYFDETDTTKLDDEWLTADDCAYRRSHAAQRTLRSNREKLLTTSTSDAPKPPARAPPRERPTVGPPTPAPSLLPNLTPQPPATPDPSQPPAPNEGANTASEGATLEGAYEGAT